MRPARPHEGMALRMGYKGASRAHLALAVVLADCSEVGTFGCVV